MKKHFVVIIAIAFTLSSCQNKDKAMDMNTISENYVKLVLEIGQYDSDFVDAYYGPEEWKPNEEKAEALPAYDFIKRATSLLDDCSQVDYSDFSEIELARLSMLQKQLTAIKTKVEIMDGKSFSFDQEAKLLYDTDPPTYAQAHFDSLLRDLERELPGTGAVSERYKSYSEQFIIPQEKLDTVFRIAIAAARKRTNEHFDLPENESFIIEYVNDKSWSAYNYYQGNSQSLIQLNTDFPIYIERAIDLACHEGYPGHHVFNALLEQNLVNDKGWKEFSAYPLFSPQSLIAEGSANYGVNVAFPGEERLKFEKEVLFPLAGIDPDLAEQYYQVQDLRTKLGYAGNEAARKYLNREITREEAATWLVTYLLYEPDRAMQRTRFFDQYRSYVINYNLGRDLVANFIEKQGGTVDSPEKRWSLFKELLSTPNTATDLK